jgi:hypothetical protein
MLNIPFTINFTGVRPGIIYIDIPKKSWIKMTVIAVLLINLLNYRENVGAIENNL